MENCVDCVAEIEVLKITNEYIDEVLRKLKLKLNGKLYWTTREYDDGSFLFRVSCPNKLVIIDYSNTTVTCKPENVIQVKFGGCTKLLIDDPNFENQLFEVVTNVI